MPGIRVLAIAGLLCLGLAGCKHLYAAGDVGGHFAPAAKEAHRPVRNAS